MFFINEDHTRLAWDSRRKKKEDACGGSLTPMELTTHSRVPVVLNQVSQILEGQKTTTFERHKAKHDEELSFSLVLPSRSLDLVASDARRKAIWIRLLQILVSKSKRHIGTVDHAHSNSAYEEYLKQMWNAADKDRSGNLSVTEVQRLLDRMNIASYNKTKSKKLIMV